jgi:hypothetical protein
MARPKRGLDAEFAKLFRAMEKKEPVEGDTRLARWREISEAPFETLGAPRVGFDKAANAWVAKRVTKAKRAKTIEAMKGYYVLDLLPECDGFPQYTNYGAYDGIDRYSFRGQFLSDVEEVLGKRLMTLAYKRMLADELARYGDALLDKARAFAKREGVTRVEKLREVAYDETSAESRAHIMFAAARWCRFWAKRRHGLEPYY